MESGEKGYSTYFLLLWERLSAAIWVAISTS